MSIHEKKNDITSVCEPRPSDERRDGWKWLVAALLVVAVLLASNWRLVSGEFSGIWDADMYFCPSYMYVADHAREGEFLRWNPLVFCGSPDGYEPQYGAFSPLTTGMGLITGGTEGGFCAYWLVLWMLGGLGMVMLARWLGAPAWAGFIAGGAYVFSGAYTGHAQHTCYIESFSFIPWIIWRLDVSLVKRRLLPALQAGGILGLAGLAGYPGVTVVTGFYAGIWAIGRLSAGAEKNGMPPQRVSSQTKKTSKLARRMLFILPVMIIFTAAASVIMSPTFLGYLKESKGFSPRSGELKKSRAVGENALHPGALSSFASPYVPIIKINHKALAVKENSQDELWKYTDASSVGIYIFPVIFCLGVFAVVFRRREWFRWFLLGASMFFLACAMGRSLPFRGWLYDIFPPMRYFRHAAFFRVFYIFSMIILALHGAKDLRGGGGGHTKKIRLVYEAWLLRSAPQATAPSASVLTFRQWYDSVLLKRAWKIFTFVSVFILAGVLIVCGVIHTIVPDAGKAGGRNFAFVHLLIAWGCVPLAGLVGWKISSAKIRQLCIPGVFILLMIFDAFFSIIISEPIMFSDGNRAWGFLENKQSHHLDLTENGLERKYCIATDRNEFAGNKNIPLKIPVLWSYGPIGISSFYQVLLDNPVFMASASGADRIWFSPSVVDSPLAVKSAQALAKRAEAVGSCPIVITSPDEMVAGISAPAPQEMEKISRAIEEISKTPGAVPVKIMLTEYTPNRLVFEAMCPEDGWLCVTDRWAPGWKATVNESPTEIWGGNFLFRAVRVKKGVNRVDFGYHPFGYPWLVVISWSMLAGILILSIIFGAFGIIKARK